MQLLRDARDGGTEVDRVVSTFDDQVLLLRVIPYQGETGGNAGVLVTLGSGAVLREATDRARAEAMLRDRSDRELVDFAYAVSHDLQAGLRHLNYGVEELKRLHAAESNAASQRVHGLIDTSAARLGAMIEGLLTYSRVHTQHQPRGLIGLDRVLDSALRTLSAQHDLSQVEMSREHLPEVVADAQQIETVMFHLLGNALKYRSERPVQIHISAQRRDAEFVVAISDNGIGIDPSNQARVFVIFQRLHRDAEIPGLGLGLPLARRIIERHGGTLTLTSTPGEGSTFRFTLPTARAVR